jgi:hypothetical protein
VLVIPLAIAGVILTTVLTLTKLYHATQRLTAALWFTSLRLCAFVLLVLRILQITEAVTGVTLESTPGTLN